VCFSRRRDEIAALRVLHRRLGRESPDADGMQAYLRTGEIIEAWVHWRGRRDIGPRRPRRKGTHGIAARRLHETGLSKVESVDQRMCLECGVCFRQLRTCRRTRPGQLWANSRNARPGSGR
jgi:hypothetical protein